MISSHAIYDRAPHWLQGLLLNVHAARIHLQRYGAPFEGAMEVLRRTQWFTPEMIEKYQFDRLKKVLGHAYATVPFYRELYDTHHVHPSDIRELGDIRKLPIISKEDVRAAGARMISSIHSKRHLVKGNTSGTTGSPLSFYWDKATCVHTAALDWRQKAWAGVSYGDRVALFLGRPIVPPSRDHPPFWHEDRIHRMLWMSSFHLSDAYLPAYVHKLEKYRPVAVEGYPSTLYIVARYLKLKDQTIPVRAVFSSSETLLPTQRALIEERFQAPLFDFYGLAERVGFATQCAEAHTYHLNFEYAVNEIIDNSSKVSKIGAPGYLVGTSLVNFGMPFIRYRTTDVSAIVLGKCLCGRHMPQLSAVTTKDEDIVVTPEGKLISASILTHAFKPLDFVLESQIIQEKIDIIVVKIVRRNAHKDFDTTSMVTGLRERLGPTMKIEIEYVDAIPRTASGKFRWVISRVNLPL